MFLKYGLVTGEYPPMEGGVGAFTRELARAMSCLGYQIHIITDRQARVMPGDRNWRRLREPFDLGFAQLHAQVNHWGWSSLAAVADLVMRYELDLVNIQYQAAAYHMRNPAINALPWRLKGIARTVVTYHDLRVPYLFPKAGPLRRMAVNFMARQAHGVIVTNPADFKAMAEVGTRELVQIPIGSNIAARATEVELTESLRARFGIGQDQFLLGYFGFLNESKGADLLLQALAQQGDDTHLLFIGGQTGSSDALNNELFFGRLQQQIRELNLSTRVHWTGFVSEEDVSGYLNAVDLMVMPYRDGLSLRRGTLMAVLAHGRPLLTTRPAVPVPELVHEQHAYLVPAGQVDPLSDAIDGLRRDPIRRANMGQEARLLADSFSWERIAEQTTAFFAGLVGAGETT